MSVSQFNQNFNAYTGIAESAVTSNVLFTGDARAVWFSLTTSSGTASVWTVQGNESDGFLTAVDSSAWQTIATLTSQGYASFNTIPRWARWQRTPSNSSGTVYVSIAVGP